MQIKTKRKRKLKQQPDVPEKKNPMEESEYCYYQSFGKALVGFVKALELRQGDIHAVSADDILDYCDVDEDEFDFLFGDAYGLYEAVRKEIKETFVQAEQMREMIGPKLYLSSVFERLRKNSPMLTTIRMVGDHQLWQDSLAPFVSGITSDWGKTDPEAYDYVYKNFCCQFAQILELWETSDFSKDQIIACVRLLKLWLKVDGAFLSSFSGVMAKTTQS